MAVNPNKVFYSARASGRQIAEEIAENYGYSVSQVLRAIDDDFCQNWINLMGDAASDNDGIIDRVQDAQTNMIDHAGLGDSLSDLCNSSEPDLAAIKTLLSKGDVPDAALESTASEVANMSDQEIAPQIKSQIAGLLISAGLDLSSLTKGELSSLHIGRPDVRSAAKKILGRSRIESLVISLA